MSATPSRTTEKKKSPAFPLLQAVQTAPEFAQKGRSHGAARAHSKTKLLRSKNGAPPLFRPGHRLKYRSKAIKIWENTKKHRPFFFFFMLCTKSRFCPRQNRAVITAKEVLYPKQRWYFTALKVQSQPPPKNNTELQKAPPLRRGLKTTD